MNLTGWMKPLGASRRQAGALNCDETHSAALRCAALPVSRPSMSSLASVSTNDHQRLPSRSGAATTIAVAIATSARTTPIVLRGM